MLGQLGCADYSARVVTRGALNVVWEDIPFTSLTYERVLDDTSTATIQIDGVDQGCAEKTALAKCVTFQHEIALYRDGPLVWVGPLAQRAAKGTRATLNGRDRSAWWDRRFIHASYALTGDLAFIFLTYFNDAMNADPVQGFTCTVTPTLITGQRSIAALDHKTAGPELREIAAIGIDWTAIGPIILAGGKTIPAAQVPVITDQHLRGDDPDVLDDGLEKVNRQIITGQQPSDPVTGQFIDGARVFGEASSASRQARDGLIEANTQDDQADDASSCAAGAASTLALLQDGAATVSTLNLGQNAPMTIDQLVPGAIIDVELTRPAIAVSGFYRIQKVSVTVDQNGENVSIDVQPIGTT